MIADFKKYIQKLSLFFEGEKLLVAVSGGIDSVVLLHMLSVCKYQCVVAHCNFALRGKESDLDEKFVKKLAASYSFPFYSKKFNTKLFASKKAVSIQMAARELRYEWFEFIRIKTLCKHILIAHNRNDNIETFLINLLRGTGISGLTGIEEKNNYLKRPLLFASREMIVKYAIKNKLQYREDSSNSDLKYTRNKIRNQVIPLLQEINPGIENTLIENIERLKNIEEIYFENINIYRNKIVLQRNGKIYILISDIKKLKPTKTYLFEFLKEYNFTQHHVEDIMKMLDSTSGKRIDSGSHVLLKDRDYLIISLNTEFHFKASYQIKNNTKTLKIPISLHCKKLNNHKNFQPSRKKSIACLDYDKLVFPLSIRKWEKGDIFYPFGMKNKKKLSDFFIDEKFSFFEKQSIWLLTSQNQIVWVIGNRIDNRFAITEDTKTIYLIES